jgi:hypothetical protein
MKKIILLFSGILIVLIISMLFTFIKVSFFDCKYGQCFTRACIDTDKKCEANNSEGYYDCCIYDIQEKPFRDYLLNQMIFYGLISGSGVGIALGVFLIQRDSLK